MVESAYFPIVIMIVPLHPIAITNFLVQAVMINVIGHLGYEISLSFGQNLKFSTPLPIIKCTIKQPIISLCILHSGTGCLNFAS